MRCRHFALVLTMALAAGCGNEPPNTRALEALQGASLAKAREQHRTKLLVQKAAPAIHEPDVPAGAEAIRYPSAGRELLAWLIKPKGEGPFPAVLYAHAGYDLNTGDYHAAKQFVDAGFVVLMPAWRGENGNPGHFEMWYGEVSDAAAALEYLATLPDVDPKRLFAAGHESGGTIVMLLAEIAPCLRAAAACGGLPDLRSFVDDKKRPLDNTPFDWRDPLENDIRSPARHVRDLKCSFMLFYGAKQDPMYLTQAARMQADAETAGHEILVNRVAGADRNTAIDRAVPAMIAFFKLKVEGKKP